ncbi:Uncharacterised protein [uncultured archaeon]|nr:Uncharacterised protein [uncultured archaeon]
MAMKCDVKSTALAAGILWGLALLFLGLISAATGGYASEFINTFGSVYFGYAPTFIGAIIGGILGFIDGAIAGAIFAWLYNYFSK